MDLVPPAEAARRARAAIAYAGLEYDEITKRTGIKDGTVRNIVSKTRPSGGTTARLHLIAVACKVPTAFMDVGFATLEDPVDDVTARVVELERSTAERFDEIEENYRRWREEQVTMPGHETLDPELAVQRDSELAAEMLGRSSDDSEEESSADEEVDQ